LKRFVAGLVLFGLLVCCNFQLSADDVIVVQSQEYGYSTDQPIYCGGGINGEKRYLSKLRGPEGQRCRFTRLSNCCHFKLPGIPVGKKRGHLSRYKVRYPGLETPVIVYLNSYKKEPLRAPDGFAIAD